MAKALSHPVRVKALEILNDRVASPSDISRELELPVANVSYHINTLLRLGCIEKVETRHVRGAVEHLYRAVRRVVITLEEMHDMPLNARYSRFSDIAATAFEDIREAILGDFLSERPDMHASWTRLRLDEEGWKELYDVLLNALNRALEIQDESVSRIEAGELGGRELRSMLSIFHYESLPR
ncbi:MAG TPA: winged helix-turn-helix domain-containing protein [Capillimicrobium sp.]|nr:winged helix-turn-helix domain-containing protein [Capillimicrobium sp.]